MPYVASNGVLGVDNWRGGRRGVGFYGDYATQEEILMAAVSRVEFDTTLFHGSDKLKIYSWTLTTADATGDPLYHTSHADKTVQVYGTLGSGTVTFQGANHPTSHTWATLTDHADNAIALTVAGLKLIAQNPYAIRPVLSGSTGATVTVIVVVKE